MQLKTLTLAMLLAAAPIAALAQTAPAGGTASTPAAKNAAADAGNAAQAGVRVDPMTPIARVNGVVLNALQIALLREDRAARGQSGQASSDELLRDALINAEILSQEAVKQGLDKTATIQAALELNRKEMLGRVLVEEYVAKHPVKDERIKAEYDRLKSKAGTTEYHARHILVADEKLAKEIAAKLKGKKVKFEDLAKKHSKDSSAESGGDLGWTSPSSLVPDFAEAMAKLKKGEFTAQPVKTRFGWHLIKLEDTRPIAFPELDKVKGRIVNQLTQNDIRQYVSELRAAAKVEVPAPAPANPPTSPGASAK